MAPKRKKRKSKAERKKEREMRQRKAKMDLLARELKHVELNKKRLEASWKRLLTKIKLEMMHEDIETAWHKFEFSNDVKDFRISLLLDEFDESQEQRAMSFRKHCENIDDLIKLFQKRLEDLNSKYEDKLADIVHNGEDELAGIQKQFKESENYYNTVMYRLEMETKEQTQNISSDYVVRIDEELDKNGTLLHNQRAVLEAEHDNLWTSFKNVLDSYSEETWDLKQDHDTLKMRDDFHTTMMKENMQRIQRQHDYLKRLKFKEDENRELDLQLADLKSERNFLANAYNTLRNKLKSDRQLDTDLLTLLAVKSNETQEFLESLAKKGENMLTLSAICRKYETQAEKVFMYPKLDDMPCDMERVLERLSYKKITQIGDFSFYPHLEGFWIRVGYADLLRHELYEEKEFLIRENKAMRAKLRDMVEHGRQIKEVAVETESHPPESEQSYESEQTVQISSIATSEGAISLGTEFDDISSDMLASLKRMGRMSTNK